MFDANRRHEDRHVEDDKKAFANHIEAWDKKLVAAKKARTKYHGATKQEAGSRPTQGHGRNPG